MKILIFFTYNQGFLSSFFHELSVKLAQEGHEMVCFSWKGSESERMIDGVKVIVKKRNGYFANYQSAYNIIKKIEPDVILSNFSYVNPALLFGKLLGVDKNIVWFHSLNAQTAATRMNILIKSFFLILSDVVIANSHHTKDELSKVFRLPKTKIKTVPFWSSIVEKGDLKQKRNNTEVKVKFGTPGRLVKHKNQRVVIKALANFKTEGYEYHIAGKGPDQDTLHQQAKQLGIDEHVIFRGHLSAEEMRDFYEEMDVIILPSLSEAFGLVFIEAISLGTPVIVSSQFGALTFIKNQKELEPIVFNPESSEELEKKLVPYFQNKGLASDYFKNLYHNNFDKAIIFNQVRDILLH